MVVTSTAFDVGDHVRDIVLGIWCAREGFSKWKITHQAAPTDDLAEAAFEKFIWFSESLQRLTEEARYLTKRGECNTRWIKLKGEWHSVTDVKDIETVDEAVMIFTRRHGQLIDHDTIERLQGLSLDIPPTFLKYRRLALSVIQNNDGLASVASNSSTQASVPQLNPKEPTCNSHRNEREQDEKASIELDEWHPSVHCVNTIQCCIMLSMLEPPLIL